MSGVCAQEACTRLGGGYRWKCLAHPVWQGMLVHNTEWRVFILMRISRSPWSNEYDPPLEDGTVPTPKLRKLEITANEAFDTYRELYAIPTRI